ncbi:MAG: bifunctional phosphopantothenoylcysteine decarboxylase/phosphopantothenate--cysteine ligase CoaBC [Thermoanaerobaculia bacterium]
MKIVLGISGGIAAYKTPDLVRRLQDAGADVRVLMTENATRFVSPLALAVVSNHGVIHDQWGDPARGGVDHIEIARWADLLLIAPATANIIAKIAAGIADDALTTYAVAHRTRLMVVPAMNTFMYRHVTVQTNLDTLRARGAIVLDPDSGLLACGDEGVGRMPDIPVIVEQVSRLTAPRDLEGRRVVITAGPTQEPIDPVRYLSNRSSGKMGYALAEAARARGASVVLVSGPTSLGPPAGIEVRGVGSAREMAEAARQAAENADVIIGAAAVADFTVATPSPLKISKRDGENELTLVLTKTPDILADLAARAPKAIVVAFAAETDGHEQNAKRKLEKKGAHLIVLNDVADASIGFDSDHNAVTILDRDGGRELVARDTKTRIAGRILDRVVSLLAAEKSQKAEARSQK